MTNFEACTSKNGFIEAFRSNCGEPQVGMVFQSEESAYEFYNAYAQRIGFRVRKDKLVRRSDGTNRKRLYVCAKEGRRTKDLGPLRVRKERPHTRTGCKARMVIKYEDDAWVLTEITCEHNHPLASPSTVYTLRSQMKVQPTQDDAIDTTDDVVMRSTFGFENFNADVRRAESLGSMDLDYGFRLCTEQMRTLEAADAQVVLDYFKRMQLQNPSFFYSVQVDKNDRVTNFFWADSRSMINYSYFGDVVCVDTTYRTNNYNLPFTPFLGVNHHKQTILFGAALLFDETFDSFVWLFETWIKAMSGRQPKTILTDQCAAMEKAIAFVLPETCHRFCLWQISQNASKLLSSAICMHPNFQNEFKKCIYENETEEDFQSAWITMLEKYNLVMNKWLGDLYEVRQRWALAYGRDIFCADMVSIERSESINELFKKHLNRNLPFPIFFKTYEELLVNLREEELREDSNSKQTEPILCVNVPMLKQAAKEYTRKVFVNFQEEYKKWLCCDVENCGEDGVVYTYKVTQFGQRKECFVSFNSAETTVVCSCKKYEFAGILCRHVMKVLNHRSIFDFPNHYILKRWTKDAKIGILKGNDAPSVQADRKALAKQRYNEFCNKAFAIAARVALTEESYLVTVCGFDKLLDEVESALKTGGVQKPQTTSPQHFLQGKEKTGPSDQLLIDGRMNKSPVDPSYPGVGITPDSNSSRPTFPFMLS